MRISLVNPPCNLKLPYHIKSFCPSIPLGLAYVASVLLEDGHEVNVIDCPAEGRETQAMEDGVCTIGLSWNDIKSRLSEFNPNIVGIACAFSSRFKNALAVAAIAKEVNPNIKTVMGGIHPTILPEETLSHENVDFAVLGEGEATTIKLLRRINKGANDFSNIDGFGWKLRNHVTVNPKTTFIQDLDKIPFPARHLFPMKEYFNARRSARWETGKESVSNPQRNTVITSRGCPFTCTFCSIHASWGYKWRSRSPRNVVDEIKDMTQTYGTNQVSFEDDNLTLNRERMMKICRLILGEKLEIQWDTPNGVSVQTLDKELLTLMKRSGCRTLKFGIESGDPHLLSNVIHKPLTINKVRQVVELCKQLGIFTIGNFVLGMPEETCASIQRTIDLACALPLDELNAAIATPYPKTRLYDFCLEKGYIKEYSYTDFPADDSMETTAMINTPTLKAEEVMQWRKRLYEEFKNSRVRN